jgi:hypothetical protein
MEIRWRLFSVIEVKRLGFRFEHPITPSRVLAIPGTFALAESSNGGHTNP